MKKWRKNYREEHKNDINKKARDDYELNKNKKFKQHILWNLNRSQNTKQPKKESIGKYNLNFDELLKRWVWFSTRK